MKPTVAACIPCIRGSAGLLAFFAVANQSVPPDRILIGDVSEAGIKANTNAENPNTRAVLFHLGKFIPTGVPDTYGFNSIEPTQSTGDTVALAYSNGTPGLESVVKFRWNGAGVELIGNTPG